jgi:hypothetical protein
MASCASWAFVVTAFFVFFAGLIAVAVVRTYSSPNVSLM